MSYVMAYLMLGAGVNGVLLIMGGRESEKLLDQLAKDHWLIQFTVLTGLLAGWPFILVAYVILYFLHKDGE